MHIRKTALYAFTSAILLTASCGGPPVHPYSARWVWRQGKKAISKGDTATGAVRLIAAHRRLEPSDLRTAYLANLLKKHGLHYASGRITAPGEPWSRLNHLAGWNREDEFHRELKRLHISLEQALDRLSGIIPFLVTDTSVSCSRRLKTALFTLPTPRLSEFLSETLPDCLLYSGAGILRPQAVSKSALPRHILMDMCAVQRICPKSPRFPITDHPNTRPENLGARIFSQSLVTGTSPAAVLKKISEKANSTRSGLYRAYYLLASNDMAGACRYLDAADIRPSSPYSLIESWLVFRCGLWRKEYRSTWNRFVGDRRFALWFAGIYQLPAAWKYAPQDLRARMRKILTPVIRASLRDHSILEWWRTVSTAADINTLKSVLYPPVESVPRVKTLAGALTHGASPTQWNRLISSMNQDDAYFTAEALAALEPYSLPHLMVALKTFLFLGKPDRASWIYDLAREASTDPYTFYTKMIPLLITSEHLQGTLRSRALKEFMAWNPPQTILTAFILDMQALARHSDSIRHTIEYIYSPSVLRNTIFLVNSSSVRRMLLARLKSLKRLSDPERFELEVVSGIHGTVLQSPSFARLYPYFAYLTCNSRIPAPSLDVFHTGPAVGTPWDAAPPSAALSIQARCMAAAYPSPLWNRYLRYYYSRLLLSER